MLYTKKLDTFLTALVSHCIEVLWNFSGNIVTFYRLYWYLNNSCFRTNVDCFLKCSLIGVESVSVVDFVL